MAVPSTVWNEIATTTLYNRTRKLADAVTKNNALLGRLEKRGTVKPFDGGVAILQEIMYA